MVKGNNTAAESTINTARDRVVSIKLVLDATQALKDDYRMTLIGHSLGAGAAALLAMMLQARGITNVHCYAFAPPMCCEPDLAAKCSDYVTSVVFRDDIISRCVPQCFPLDCLTHGLPCLCCTHQWSQSSRVPAHLRKFDGVSSACAHVCQPVFVRLPDFTSHCFQQSSVLSEYVIRVWDALFA